MPGPDDTAARLVLSPEEERAYEQPDLRRAVWAYLSELRHSADFVKLAAPAASMMRVILALGDEPGDRAAAIAALDRAQCAERDKSPPAVAVTYTVTATPR